MPVTLNNTTITIDDGTNNFVLETVKTHVPEVDINIDIVPAITYPDTTTRNLQLAAESNTGVNGWRLVRFLPSNSGTWYSGNHFTSTNMEVTASLGTAYNYSNEFMVPFGTYDEIFFSTGDMTYWVYALKSSVLGNYSNSARNVIKSSVNTNPHTINWYNRSSGNNADPIITHLDYGSSGAIILYIDNGVAPRSTDTHDGLCVFVRTSTDTISSSIIPAMPVYEDTTHQLQNLAEQKTGVKGWIHVKHLPASSTTWFYKDDDLQGVNYGTPYDTNSQWSITYPSDMDEILLVKDGSTFEKWLRIDKSVPTTYQSGWYGGYAGTHMTAIDSSLSDKRYAYFNDGRSGAPWFWIGPVSHNLYSSILYQEDSENVSTWPSASANPENVSYEVFVRKSTDIVTVNPEPVYKTLTFEYHNEHIPTEGMAENATGVYGWSHVKHLNKNATQWYPDNTEEGRDFFTVADQVFDSHGSFTKPFPEHFDELLFTRSDGNGNVDRFVHCLKTDLETIIAYTNWTNNITSIKTQNGTSSLFNGFGRYSSYVNRAPMILSRNSFTDQGDYSVYEEHYQTTSANEGGPWGAPVANKQYDVYARMSIPVQTSYTVNFQAESECDILIVGGGGAGGVYNGGGGGGGGVLYATNLTLNGEYIVKVGKGGDVATTNTQSLLSENGYNTLFGKSGDLLEVFGGGRGGNANGPTVTTNKNGADGGSGGGGSNNNGIGGYPIQPNYSTEITSANSSYYGGTGGTSGGDTNGGGGGAGNITPNRKNGADGIQINIDGNNYYWGGGGGGADWNNLGGSGGKGGGGGAGGTSGNGGSGGTGGISVGSDGTGSGGVNAQTGVGGDGGPGTGGGGGANAAVNGSMASGNGGSGIVIIRYNTKYIRQHPAYDAQWTYHSANPNVHYYGNVGIGTLASETNKLTVKGDINIIGDIYENNNKIAYGWNVSGNSVYNQYGNVGIGTNDPRYALHTTGIIYAGQGGITETGSTTWTITSDNRIKDNIEKASYDICSENIKNINLYRFNYNNKYVKTTDKNQLGFIAQDVRKYFPKAVKNKTTRFDNGVVPNLLSVDVTQLNYTMYGAVKHIGQDIDAIKEKLGITELPNDVKNQPYFTEVVPFNDPDAELPIVNEEPATN